MQNNDEHRYDDMIDLPHHVSSKHPQMSLYDRAAQFSAFKALTGYEDAVTEAARLTGQRIELDDATMSALNAKVQILQDEIKNRPNVSVTYFVPDKKKDGGEYVTMDGSVKRIDDVERTFTFTDGKVIQIDDIIDINGEIFAVLYYGEKAEPERNCAGVCLPDRRLLRRI